MKHLPIFVVALIIIWSQTACVEVVWSEPPVNETQELRSLFERGVAPSLRVDQVWLVETEYLQGEAFLDNERSDEIRNHRDVLEQRVLGSDGVESGDDDEDDSRVTTWAFRVLGSSWDPSLNAFDRVRIGADDDFSGAYVLVEATVADESGGDAAIKSLNPVFHLLIRNSDFSLAAAELSYWAGEERIVERREHIDNGTGATGWGLAMSDGIVDLVLPEFPLEDSETREMTVTELEGGGIEVAFTDVTDGGLIVQRWDAGRPWFTYSLSDHRISRLLSIR